MDIKVKDIIKLGIAMIFFVYLASILVIPIVLIFNLDLESIDYQTLTFIDMSISLIQCVIVVITFVVTWILSQIIFKLQNRKKKR